MDTRIEEVADGIHQISTYLAEMDFSINQYLVTGAEPLLFHTGMRGLFPLVTDAVSRVVPAEQLRWIAFGHVEADECGAMNQWLSLAPQATVAQGTTGCMISISDMADREPRPLKDSEVLDIGGHRLRWIDTPHVPHCWEAGLLYDETTRTLLCGDLFSQMGSFAASTSADIVGPAIAAEDAFPGSSSLSPTSGATIRRLADLDIDTLALMHGPAYTGDCGTALLDLADDFDKRAVAAS
jgi:flavorubredoxin